MSKIRRRYERVIQKILDKKISKKEAAQFFENELAEMKALMRSYQVDRMLSDKMMTLLERALTEAYGKELDKEEEREEKEREEKESEKQ